MCKVIESNVAPADLKVRFTSKTNNKKQFNKYRPVARKNKKNFSKVHHVKKKEKAGRR